MAQVDPERLILPALLTLLVLGTFIIVVTNGGGDVPAPVTEPAPKSVSQRTTAKAAPERLVKVRAGDTATSIAQEAGISLERLRELNPSADPDALQPGQTLKLAP
jgi:LysM repeat protein